MQILNSNILSKPIDNIQLIVFRIFFGLLMVAESWGAICTGWVSETFIEPQFTFTFMGFEWTQFLIGSFTRIKVFGQVSQLGYMHIYFFIMGCFGWAITFGWRYRIAAIGFASMWSLAYFMQKSHYNNHYYLVMLIGWFMALAPASCDYSLDVKVNRLDRSQMMFSWVRWFMIIQMAIVYVFAAIAKLYPGWLSGRYLHLRLRTASYWFEKDLGWEQFAATLSSQQFALTLSWLGLAFDFLIIPMLLYKRSRWLAFVFALMFHLFNSATLHIGIFPYFALACCVFFFEPQQVRQFFFKSKQSYQASSPTTLSAKSKRIITTIFCMYFIVQVCLPLRHWIIKEDVLWTEEGHRLSWRMMLRSKGGRTTFNITDLETGEKSRLNLSEYLTTLQSSRVQSKPDMMWQFGQKVKKKYADAGISVSISAQSNLSINGGPFHYYINDTVDIANTKWKYFGHQDWILPAPDNYYKRQIE